MLRILQKQIDALEDNRLKKFEERMIRHLRNTFTAELQGADDLEVRALVRRGVQRAESYGITLEHEVCLYLRVAVIRGQDFDVDPSRPWIRYMLSHPRRDGISRMEEIHDRVMKHRDAVDRRL